MKIILCYSLVHYNPSLSEEEHIRWGSSTNILARSLYKILSEIGDVTYIDEKTIDQFKGHNFDVAIGTISAFKQLTETVNANIKILFNAQMHPIERNRLFLKFINKNGLYKNDIVSWSEILDIPKTCNAIYKADYLLGVGNIVTQNSFIKYGVNPSKLKFLNYGIIDHPPNSELQIKTYPIVNIIYFATEIGLRKGFDIISDIFENIANHRNNYVLHIVGRVSNDFYIKKLNSIKEKIGERFIFHGWIDSNSVKYTEMLNIMDVLLFPSIEEGQAGTVIDCLRKGVIPILSKNTGVDFSPLGYFELELKNKNNLNLIEAILDKTEAELLLLKSKTLQYYKEFHENFYGVFKKTIIDAINKNPHPKLSIIIPIAKEQSNSKIFLKSLKKSLNKYYNIECHFLISKDDDSSKKRLQNILSHNTSSFKLNFHELAHALDTKSINLILKKSTGKYCIIVQDDTILKAKNFLYDVAHFLDINYTTAILGSTTRNIDLKQGIYNEGFTKPYKQNIYFEVDAYFGKTIAIKKSFLEEVDFLDETKSLHKDIYLDLCLKARNNGYNIFCYYDNDEKSQNNLCDEKNNVNDWFRNVKNNLRFNYLEITNPHSKQTVTNKAFTLFQFISLLFLPFVYKILKELKLKIKNNSIGDIMKILG